MSTISRENRSIYAALASRITFGPKSFQHLAQLGHSLAALWAMEEKALQELNLHPRVLSELVAARKIIEPEQILTSVEEQGITLLTIEDDVYPELLKQIAVPPAVLYVRGELTKDPLVAIVGSRRMTDYGRRVTQDLAQYLALQGVGVVSGLALGIDGAAHQAALTSNGTTIGVLASGVDRIYPASHGRLAHEMIERGGAVMSEFPPGTEALKHHFPIRNRIIAGLSRATIVVEAAQKSGSLLTARSALEEGRDVFAVPGSMYSPLSAGPHFLIQMGAKLLQRPDDILTELGLLEREGKSAQQAVVPDSAEEAALLGILTSEPTELDVLVNQVSLDPATILSTLTLMEMKGRVRNVGGNLFVRR